MKRRGERETNAKGRLDTFGTLLLRCEINAAQFTKAAFAGARRGGPRLSILQVPQFHHARRIPLVHGGAIASPGAAFLAAAFDCRRLWLFRDSCGPLDALLSRPGANPFREGLCRDAHGIFLHFSAGASRGTDSAGAHREEGLAFRAAYVRCVRAGARLRHGGDRRSGRHRAAVVRAARNFRQPERPGDEGRALGRSRVAGRTGRGDFVPDLFPVSRRGMAADAGCKSRRGAPAGAARLWGCWKDSAKGCRASVPGAT